MHEDLPTPPTSTFVDGRILITEILDREPGSILRPLTCRASDGKRYFIKSRNSDKIPLICEWVCSRLAHALDLRCPEVCLAWLPVELVRECSYSDYDIVPGWAFASLAIDLADNFPKAESKLVPEDERRRLLAFDHWIHNSDRRDANPNLLWLASKRLMWVIDHHLTLSADPIRGAEQTHIFREDWQGCWENEQGEEIRAWLQTGRDQLEAILATLPDDWTKTAGDFVEKIRILLHRPLP